MSKQHHLHLTAIKLLGPGGWVDLAPEGCWPRLCSPGAAALAGALQGGGQLKLGWWMGSWEPYSCQPAVHASLCFLYPWYLWSSWWGHRASSCGFAFHFCCEPLGTYSSEQDWKEYTLSALALSCLHFSYTVILTTDSVLLQHHFLASFWWNREKSSVKSLGCDLRKKSRKSTVQTASNQRSTEKNPTFVV